MEISGVIREIDAEISRLQQARALLSGDSAKRGPGRPKGSGAAPAKKGPKRQLSAEARKRIADAQKKRWAEQRKAQK